MSLYCGSMRTGIQLFGVLALVGALLAQNVEQNADGRRPAARITAQFDGLGAGFEGPHGTAALRNPSDFSRAAARPDQPPVWTARSEAYESPIGVPNRIPASLFPDYPRPAIWPDGSNTAAGGGGGVRWYEFRIDGAGNIGIGYSYGDAMSFSGQRFAARRAGDPPGQLTTREAILAQGEAAQTSTMRWQDYTQTAVDPSDDCTIWYVGDYVKKDASSYSSRVGAFRIPGCTS